MKTRKFAKNLVVTLAMSSSLITPIFIGGPSVFADEQTQYDIQNGNTSFANIDGQEIKTITDKISGEVIALDITTPEEVKTPTGAIMPMAAVIPAADHDVYTKVSTSKVTDWSHKATNPSSTADAVTYSVSISRSNTVSAGGNAEFNGIVSKLSISVGYSNTGSKTETASIQYSIPKGSWVCRAGHQTTKATHHHWHTDTQGTKSGDWTRTANASLKQSWSDKIAG